MRSARPSSSSRASPRTPCARRIRSSDPRIFAVPRLRAGALGVTVAFFGLFALFFVNAQYLQFAKGYSPALTGVAIGPLAIGMMVTSPRSVTLAARFGARPVVAAGLLGIAAGLGLLSLADAGTPYPLYAVDLLVMSVGMGLCVPSLSASVIGALPHGRAGVGSGINGATREVGSALGAAVLGTVINQHLGRRPVSAVANRHVFTEAMSAGYRLIAVIVLLATVLVVTWHRKHDIT